MDLMMRKMLHSLNALADLGAEVSSTHAFEEVMKASLYTLLGAVASPRGAITTYSSRPSQLKIVAAKGIKNPSGDRIALNRDEVYYFISCGRSLAIGSDSNGLGRFEERNGGPIGRLRAHLAIPMVTRGDLMGVIFISNKLAAKNFTDEDLAMLETIARHIGMAVYNQKLVLSLRRRLDENRRLYRGMRRMHQDTIRAFAAAIDLKDAYTKGHSDRVARYAEAIAREIGLSGTELEHISVAAYLHDIGKIVIDRSIINNPRPLTEREYQELNKHVTTGYEILSNISHPWKEIAYMTKCHHEKVDGTGYPQGLRGDQIPLGAKIVTVADSYDAMITDRPYRSRLPLDRALSELQRHTGKQFAPEVVVAFCRLLVKELTNRSRERVLTAAVGANFDRKAVAGLASAIMGEIEATLN